MAALTGGIVVVGVLVDVVAYASDRGAESYWREFFSLDAELNLPTWWSVLLLAVAAWLAYATPDDVASDHTALHRHKWRLLGLILFAMSLDEAAIVHETVGEWIQDRVDTGSLLTYAWVIPGAIAVVAVALLYLRFVLALPQSVRTRMILAAGTYVAGALIVEMIDGDVNGRTSGTSSASKIFFTSVQEAMELAGVLLALSALLLIRREAERGSVGSQAGGPQARVRV